jgi:hypothetical protein
MSDSDREAKVDTILTAGSGVGAYNIAEYGDLFEPVAQGLEGAGPEYAAAARVGLPMAFGAAVGLGTGRAGRFATSKIEDGGEWGMEKVDSFLNGETDEIEETVDGMTEDLERTLADYGVSAGSAVMTYDLLSFTDIATSTGDALEPVDPGLAAAVRSSPVLVWGAGGGLVGLGAGRVANKSFDLPEYCSSAREIGGEKLESMYEKADDLYDDTKAYREKAVDIGRWAGDTAVDTAYTAKDLTVKAGSGAKDLTVSGYRTGAGAVQDAYDWTADWDVSISRPRADNETEVEE